MVRAHGLDVTEGLEKHIAGLLGFGRATLSPMGRLAVTCALEHFTATLAEQLLRDARIYGTMHPAIRPLWQWHSVEELEHKSVAYDVYRQMGGGYALRASMMLLTTFLFFVEISHIHMRFLAAKGELLRPRTWLSSVDYFWVRPGVYRRFLPRYLAYFRPGFHPHDRDTASLLDEWRERLFGEQGALRVRDERARQVA
jgi:predicted metal-dependent hydrolase